MNNNNPFHEGELAVQERVNEADMARMNGRVITDSIPAGALNFIEQQSMAVLGSLDSHGHVWCSVIFGEPGYLRSNDVHTLEIDLNKAGISKNDPLWTNLDNNTQTGLLVIELGSRRRLRINGCARKVSAEKYVMDVEQAYPNCPKYIQRRHVIKAIKLLHSNDESFIHGKILNAGQKALISNADTFFVASAHLDPQKKYSVDASHRGGLPGFVHILNDNLIRIPDYSGNSMFNTLGNFQSYPHAGLVFIDFNNSRILQLSGKPEIIWQLDDADEETGGTQRYWQFEINAWVETRIPFDIDWELLDFSPFNPEPSSSQTTTAKTLSLRVEKITQESSRIKSFILSDSNGETLPEFQSGAHLKLKVNLPGNIESERNYSILSDPDDRSHYEIGVQLEPDGNGGSLYMHSKLREGDILASAVPKNDFPMNQQANHTILIAGGIGITPILSMLHRLASQKQSYEVHYAVRTRADLTFIERIQNIAGNKLHCYTSRDKNGSRLDLQKLLASPDPGTHVYICGPRRMISSIRDITTENGWLPDQIHYESFGIQPSRDDHQFTIHLAKSRKTMTVAANRTILDTLLDAGIDVPHECKRGECTMCKTPVLNGVAEHRDLCLNKEERMESMCVCVSRAISNELELDL